jgi:hypothetical protein
MIGRHFREARRMIVQPFIWRVAAFAAVPELGPSRSSATQAA